ncbi:MAG: preprotein translocase subunit YajC [Sulfuriflexus sp.]|nr:preprotein translocase subunit YajC [Sulfuriflexus sp.]
MSFFISEAMAEGTSAGAAGGGAEQLFIMVAIFAVFYFLLIRPQTKRAKEHRKMVSELSKGDEVITNGGVYGKLTKIADDHVEVEIADNTTVLLQRQAIASILPKGTIKNL